MADSPLTATDIIAAASACLESGDYTPLRGPRLEQLQLPSARVYEDPYSVVALLVYETWRELASKWTDAQAALVELMSAHMTSDDPKSWEGYLVLLTPGVAPGEVYPSVADIRYDVSRVRKLIATGNELTQISDVERTLLPLLPMQPSASAHGDSSVLSLLPALLAGRDIDERAVTAVIDAFIAQEPLVESLHHYRAST